MKILRATIISDVDKYPDYDAMYISNILNTVVIDIPKINIIPAPPVYSGYDIGVSYQNFSMAAIELETYIVNEQDYNSPDKSIYKDYYYALYTFGDHSLNNIEKIIPYIRTTYDHGIGFKDLLLFEHDSFDRKHSWVFGEISGMLKWSSVLFKYKNYWKGWHRDMRFYESSTSFLTPAIQLATRIGLDVRSVS